MADRAPTIALAKDPERQARGGLQMSYRIEDDYGVTEAQAHFAARPGEAPAGASAPRPLFEPPHFPLALPNARTRNGIGQTVKDLSEDPYAGADVTLTLTAKDEAGHYLGLYSVARQLEASRSDDDLREVVASLWAFAVTIEDGDITDVDKALRAAQDALKQALDRGASDEEIRKLTQDLRAALDNFLRQLAEQLRNNPQQLARPLDPNTRVLRQQDLDNLIERMERLSRSGDKEAAKQLLEQLQQMLENLQMAQPGQGDSDMEQALNELSDMIRKQQQLRDKTFKQGQDSRQDHMRGKQGGDQSMGDLRQDQQGLRDRLQKLQQELARRGMGPNQRGDQGQADDQDGGEDGLGQADSAMGDAGDRLGEGNADAAVDAQGKALEALRKGAQSLADAMQQGDGLNDGPGERMGRQQAGPNATDPLGRPLRSHEYDELSKMIPGEIDVQRVRRILEELRRRLGDLSRPQLELDYIERLLKDY